MTIVTGIVAFSIIWWTVLFAVLPFGVKTSANPEKGHADSAPINPQIGKKFLITTLLSIILFLGAWYLIELNPLNL